MDPKQIHDSVSELVERNHLNDIYNIQYNFLEYGQLAFSIRNKNSKFNHHRKQAIGPDLPLLLSMV